MSKFSIKTYLPALGWFALILILLTLPGSEFPNPIPWMKLIHFDKWVHAGLFAALNWLMLLPAAKHIHSKRYLQRRIWFTTLSVIAWGLTTEFIQDQWIPNRSFEWADWAADSVGAIIGAVYFKYCTLKKYYGNQHD